MPHKAGEFLRTDDLSSHRKPGSDIQSGTNRQTTYDIISPAIMLEQDKILEEFTQLEQATYGPDKYVVRAIKMLILSNERLETAINTFKDSTKEAQKSTEKSERFMAHYTKLGIFVATAQLILAAVQFFHFYR